MDSPASARVDLDAQIRKARSAIEYASTMAAPEDMVEAVKAGWYAQAKDNLRVACTLLDELISHHMDANEEE